jgi:predicted metalloprotease with PDZ domain
MKFKLTVILIFLALQGSAQTIYEIAFPNPNNHYIHVDIHFNGLPADSFDVKMPVWTPGSYMVREYSRNVENFEAYDTRNQPVRFTKVRKNVWRVYNDTIGAMSVRYKVYAYELTVRTCFVDIDHAYINGAALYMYTDSLKNKPVLVNFKPWKGWNQISTGLQQFSTLKWSRVASNYDELADCPTVLGNQDVFTFDYNGIPHHVAMVGKAEYDREKIKSDFYKIVDECTRMFGENPNKEYTFIVHNVGSGGGGLEHMNSTSVITSRSNYGNDKGYKGFLSLIAHEYFHLWIVKRVRPLELGPFDYENEVYSRQLWFFEGFTSFYDEYLLYRTGFYTQQEYLNILKDNIEFVLNTPGDKIQSLSESSFDAWIKFYRQNENSRNSTVSYYSKGATVGLLLHLEIMNATKGEKSLDDVMAYLYHQHFKTHGRGITDAELKQAIEHIAGKNLDEFFRKYIDGTDRLPVEEYFALAGMNLKVKATKELSPGYLGATFNQSGSRLLISFVERGSAAWEQGLNVNDEIVEVDDKEPQQVRDYLAEKQPGDQVTFKIIRSGLMRQFTIILGHPTGIEFELSPQETPSELQNTVRSKWLPK